MRYWSTSTTIISLLAIQLIPVYVSALVPASSVGGTRDGSTVVVVTTPTFPRPRQLPFHHVPVCARKATSTVPCITAEIRTTSRSTSTRLWGSSVPQTDTNIGSTTEEAAPKVDVEALLLYHGAIVIQMTIIGLVFIGLDAIVDQTGIVHSIPTWALVPLFYALSLKSRVFNPLNNERPNLKQAMSNNSKKDDTVLVEVEDEPPSRGFGDRIMPSWTPPGPVFPIMWLLIIGPLRAYSSALVWQATAAAGADGAGGHYFFSPAIMALVFHLAVGDVWNTMNNTEQRYGAAVTGVLCVTASAVNAVYQYHNVDTTAGTLLGLVPLLWFGVASSLVTATWKLNPQPSGGSSDGTDRRTTRLDPLYPVVREGRRTSYMWFNNGNRND